MEWNKNKIDSTKEVITLQAMWVGDGLCLKQGKNKIYAPAKHENHDVPYQNGLLLHLYQMLTQQDANL